MALLELEPPFDVRDVQLARRQLDLALQVPRDGRLHPLRAHRARRRAQLRRPQLRRAVRQRLHEVRRAEAPLPLPRHERLPLRALGRVARRPPRRDHPVQDAVPPPENALRVLVDGVNGWAPRDRRQSRGLGQRQLARRLVEPEAARRAHAAHARTERRAVHVLLEDGVLRQRRLDAQRERRLVELAEEVAAVRADQARELHRQRRRARYDPRVRQVGPRGPRHRERVYTGVIEEAPVLGREHRVLQVVAHLGERHGARPCRIVRPHLAHRAAVAIHEPDGLGPHAPELGR